MSNFSACENCGTQFQAKRNDAKFCSGSCRTKACYMRKAKGLGNTSIETIEAVDVEYIQEEVCYPVEKFKPNPEYSRVMNHLDALEKEYWALSEEAGAVSAKMNGITDYAALFGTIGFGSGYVGTGGENIPNKLGNALASGLIGVGIGELFNSFERTNRRQQIYALQNRYNEVLYKSDLVFNEYEKIFNTQLKLIPEQIPYTDIEKKTVKVAKQKPQQEFPKQEIPGPGKEKIAVERQGLESILSNTNAQRSSFVSSQEVEKMNFKYVQMDGKFEWLGKLGEPFEMIVYGKPGGGKSTVCLQFGHYLAAKFGNKVLFISTEEGISASLQDKIKRLNLAHELLVISSCKPMLTDLSGYRFIIIDSVNDAGMSSEHVQATREKYPKTSFVNILQSTKDGNFRGSNAYTHNADIVIRVDAGTAEIEKSRFGVKNSHLIQQ